MRKWCLLLVTGLALFSAVARAEDPAYITFPADVAWATRRSPHFEVIFRQGRDALGERVLRLAEQVHKVLAPYFPAGPDLTRIVLADFQDSTNGYSLVFPWPHFVLFLSPPEPISQLSALDDWLLSLILHEYVHTLHIYPASGLWSPMRTVFGAWVVPNGMMPTHFHEGMATLLETELTAGGRGKSSSFRMGVRMAVKAGVWNKQDLPLDRFEATPTLWPLGVSPYFYGYYLHEELLARRGKKGIYDLTDAYSRNWPYFLDGPLQEVYGTTYEKLWDDIFAKTGARAKAEIEQISKAPLSELVKISQGGYYKWDVTLSPDGKRALYRKADPPGGPQLSLVDSQTGKIHKTIDFAAGPAPSICWGKRDGKDLLLHSKVARENNSGINHLSAFWLDEEESFRLEDAKGQSFAHLHSVACRPSLGEILIYQEVATVGHVRELRWETAKKKEGVVKVLREWALPTGTWVSSLLYQDEVPLIALREGLKTSLYRWQGKVPTKILEIPAHAYNLRKGKHANEVLAIATLDGRDEVWAFNTATKEATKVLSVLGGLQSFDEKDGKFLATSYEHGGYDVVKAKPIASARIKLSERKTPARKLASTEPVPISASESYFPLSTLLPRTWIPMALFVPDGAQFSVWIPGFDISQRHFYNIVGGYDTRGLPFALLDYNYRFANRVTFDTGVSLLPSYLFVAKTFQERWGAKLGVTTSLPFFPPSLRIGAIYRKIESSPLGLANRSVGADISLSYRFGVEQKPLSISPTGGTRLSISHSQFFTVLGSDDNYYSTVAAIEQHLGAPWAGEHAFYLALRGGYTEGNSIFNSYYVAGGELMLSQGRGYFLNRGFQPESLLGRQVVNANFEYRFPLFRVDRGISLLPFHLRNLHAALTWDMTTTDLGTRHPRDTYTSTRRNLFKVFYQSVGGELRSEWNMFFYLPTQIRFGLYHGFGGESLYATLGLEAGL